MKTERVIPEEAELETQNDLVMDFAMAVGEQLILCGVELWRAEDLLHMIFDAYEMDEASVMILPNMLTITARKKGRKTMTRQRNIGEAAVNLEKLTNLKRLVYGLEQDRPEPEKLMPLFRSAMNVKPYPFWARLTGTICALLALVYLFGGGLREGAVTVVCAVVILTAGALLRQIRGANIMLVNAVSAFLAGTIAILAYQYLLPVNPYIVITVSAFSLLPGIPLINSARELMYGRTMSGSFLLLEVVVETLFIAGGYYIAIALFGL